MSNIKIPGSPNSLLFVTTLSIPILPLVLPILPLVLHILFLVLPILH